MNENENDIIESQNDTEETVNNEVEVENTYEVDEIENLRQENLELQKQKEHWRKKAETPKATVKVEIPKPASTQSELSQMDLVAVIRAQVEDEDISDVTDYAKLKGISVAESLKAPFVRTLLAQKAEERKTSEVSNTGTTRRSGGNKVSPQTLLQKAEEGDLPESDSDLKAMLDARYTKK